MTDTVRLHYVEHGQGQPVLLLHGFPLDHRIWRAQMHALSDAYRLIAPDLRGHGRSPAPEGAYEMDLLAADVVALLDDLAIEQAVWVGHSMGGYVVMAGLRTAPERINGVGLVATHPYPDSDERRQQRLHDARRVVEKGSGEVTEKMMAALFAPGFDRAAPVAQEIHLIMSHTPALGMVGALRGMAHRPDSVETLHDMRVPAVVIAGTADAVITPETIKRMVLEMPQTRLVMIEDAGHLPMIENPDATTAALRAFLESLFSGR